VFAGTAGLALVDADGVQQWLRLRLSPSLPFGQQGGQWTPAAVDSEVDLAGQPAPGPADRHSRVAATGGQPSAAPCFPRPSSVAAIADGAGVHVHGLGAMQDANRLRSLLREFFPAALTAFADLTRRPP
jgi:hypothetical protein